MKAIFDSIIKFFNNHPYILALNIICGIVGLPFGIYAFLDARSGPDLTYCLNPVRTTVIKANTANTLKVFAAGKELNGDVTAVQLAFWNEGKSPVRGSDILKPVQIQTGNTAQILEVTITKVSRPEIQFEVDQSHIGQGEVKLNWKILETGDGAVLQIIYAGNTKNTFSVNGTIVGQQKLSERSVENAPSPEEGHANHALHPRVLGIINIVLASLVILASVRNDREEAERIKKVKEGNRQARATIEERLEKLQNSPGLRGIVETQLDFLKMTELPKFWMASIILRAICVCIIALAIYMLFGTKPTAPPFGF